MPVIRVMIAENDPAQIETICAALARKDSIEIASIVSSREMAVKQLNDAPDIILLNPEVLKDYSLSRFIHSVQLKSPSTKVVSTLHQASSDENLISDIKKGVRGYLRTTDAPAIMVKAIHAVYDGSIWAERRILEKAIANPTLLPEPLQVHVQGYPSLTNREREMLNMVLRGDSNKEIAINSDISERTVKTHLYRVYRKLNVKSRTKVMALLQQQ